MAGDKQQHKVFAPESTRAFFGALTDRVGAWAGRPVLMLAPAMDKDPTLAFEEHKQLLRDFIKHISPDEVLDEREFGRKAKKFYDKANKEPGYEISHLLEDNGNHTGSFIYTGPQDRTKEEIASQISGLPQEALENLPGTDMEWHALILMHESSHAHNPYVSLPKKDPGRMSTEARADQSAIEIYAQEVKNGSLQTKDVPRAFMAMRAIGAFIDSSPSHNTGPAVKLSDEHEPAGGTGYYFDQHFQETKNKIFIEAGKGLLDSVGRQISIAKVLNNPKYNISDSDRKLLTDTAKNSDLLKDEHAFEEQLSALSGSAQEALKKELDKESIFQAEQVIHGTTSQGRTVTGRQPELLYETTRKLYVQGAFDDSQIGKQYAYEFLKAAQDYAPTHFKVADSPATKLEPPMAPGSEMLPQATTAPAFTTP